MGDLWKNADDGDQKKRRRRRRRKKDDKKTKIMNMIMVIKRFMASDIRLRTTDIMKEETRCRHFMD